MKSSSWVTVSAVVSRRLTVGLVNSEITHSKEKLVNQINSHIVMWHSCRTVWP